ncbi:HRSL1 enzyme, partial [Acrocephalus arundinaceus]|nr:HRSL1 enzyme [Acrocephalus arundinaceus]
LRAPEMAEGRGHPRPGDLVSISRPGYQHWTLYVGDGFVIHVTGKAGESQSGLGSSSRNSTAKAKVKKELLTKVAGKHKWRVKNKHDRSHTPRPVEEIIQLAEKCIGMEVSYDLLAMNCEHFATWLRYGEGVSGQVS